jgi:RNA polymerase primary sigma factor
MKILTRMTDRSARSINLYFDEVNKIPMLTTEEETIYGELALEGDEEAQQLLVRGNLRFVISIAKQYQNRGLKIGDLIDEGNIGLIEASSRYDPTKGFKFISYAVWYIRRAIITALKDVETPCTIPHSRIDRMNKLRKVITNLENQLEREITISDLYGADDFNDSEIEELYYLLNSSSTSMNSVVGEDGFMLSDVLPSNSFTEMTQDVENDYNANLICKLSNKLSNQGKEVVSYLHGLNGYELLSQAELGEKLGLTRQRIDQIYKGALSDMRYLYKGVNKA